MRHSAWVLLLCSSIIISSFVLIHDSVLAAPNIPAGYDLFQTDSLNTNFTFTNEFTIPPNFFGPGSDPFQGQVQFGGVPLGNFMGQYVGTADTIVQRKSSADLSSGMATVPIELVALSLQSVNPITVTYHGGMSPSFFDVFATISGAKPSNGTMTINSGGTFNSALTVYPFLIFTRENDSVSAQLDVGNPTIFNQICGSNPQQCLSDLTLKSTGTPWILPPCPPDAFIVPSLNDQFCPSTTTVGPTRSIEQSRIDRHSVIPIQEPHWKCYQIVSATQQTNKAVRYHDQFVTSPSLGVWILSAQLICNPVAKFFVQNRAYSPSLEPHYKCYTTNLTIYNGVRVLANTTTQFNNDTNLDIDATQWLCVQASKLVLSNPSNPGRTLRLPIPQPAAAIACYTTDNTGKSANRPAMLWDQFHNETVQVASLSYFCAPALMSQPVNVTTSTGAAVNPPPFPTGTPPASPHWGCYDISGLSGPLPALNTKVNLRDVFENESGVTVTIPKLLCAFAVKHSVIQERAAGTPLVPSALLIALVILTVAFSALARRIKKTSSIAKAL